MIYLLSTDISVVTDFFLPNVIKVNICSFTVVRFLELNAIKLGFNDQDYNDALVIIKIFYYPLEFVTTEFVL